MEIKMNYCYLWVINESKVIEILWEKTPNEKDETGKLVKHSNITSGGKAYNGGEMYFGKDNVHIILLHIPDTMFT